MTKLFLTGATGYIGGDALLAIASAHPVLEITALVRNSDKGAKVAAEYPKVTLVYGDLDSTELLTEEASKADVVVHTAHADHVGAANALVAGLAKKQSPGYLIHTSGTGLFTTPDYNSKRFGEESDQVYDDWDGIGEVTSLPADYLHRNVDEIILAASSKSSNICTAIVCPPCIHGPGRGPDNQRSIQAPRLTNATLERGKGFQIGKGRSRWTQVHVQDLSDVYASLVTAAPQELDPETKSESKATWNDQGYYLVEAGTFFWGDIGRAVASVAHAQKLIDTADVDSITAEEAEKLSTAGSRLWGNNSRISAIRARKLLGWEPKRETLEQTLEQLVDSEARALGLIKGHREKVT